MKKLAIVSIVLLLAGMGLALGQAGSCVCPSSESCAQTGCLENCTGPCTQEAEGASSCPINTAPCCGK